MSNDLQPTKNERAMPSRDAVAAFLRSSAANVSLAFIVIACALGKAFMLFFRGILYIFLNSSGNGFEDPAAKNIALANKGYPESGDEVSEWGLASWDPSQDDSSPSGRID